MFSLSTIARSDGDPKIVTAGASAVPGADRLAKGIGWFSIALGATQLLAPQLLTRTLGMRGSEGLMRVFGLREIASGVLTLSSERRTGIASRIFGDGLDLVALATAFGPHNRRRENVGLALAFVAGVTLLDLATSKALADKHGRRGTDGRGEKPKSYADRSGFPGKKAKADRTAPRAETAAAASLMGSTALTGASDAGAPPHELGKEGTRPSPMAAPDTGEGTQSDKPHAKPSTNKRSSPAAAAGE